MKAECVDISVIHSNEESQAKSLAFLFRQGAHHFTSERSESGTWIILKPENFERANGIEFSGFSALGITHSNNVDDCSSYPHVQASAVYMGKLGRSTHHVSPGKNRKEWPHRRNSSVFPSIPNPYYDDYDHVYISLRKS